LFNVIFHNRIEQNPSSLQEQKSSDDFRRFFHNDLFDSFAAYRKGELEQAAGLSMRLLVKRWNRPDAQHKHLDDQ